MRNDDTIKQIQAVRARLREIEEKRAQLPDDASSEDVDLKKEEQELRARLIRLQDATIKNWDTAELPGIPG
jgi:hypothetical protein